MELRQMGNKAANVLTVDNGENIVEILFSYTRPVAAIRYRNDQRTGVWHGPYYSVTTSSHVNQFLKGIEAHEVPEHFFATLLEIAPI